jgi:hypothetical protein
MTGFLTSPAAYPYRTGNLFLGLDPATNAPVGISTERHAITIAGAGSGKGAAFLIPNALRWPHNLLVVDPKGENAAAVWQARETLGQSVHVLDPFKVANVPDRLRATFNPLGSITPESLTGREDIEVIADGLVKRSNPHHEEWYDGAAAVLAGLMAYVVESAPPAHRTLAGVRSLLLQPNEALYEDAQRMLDAVAFGGLARAAGVTIMTAIESEKGMEKEFLGGARRYTKWLDSPPISATLSASSFDLADLKTGRASVFLVLPPQYIETHAAFLRLFVRASINAMMSEGATTEGRCLFLLDEFYSLGKLDIIAKAAGLMRGYGLHLWPFLQDLGQLRELYGERTAETFFGNADAAVFFGNTDHLTLRHVSERIGNLTASEVVAAPPKNRHFNPFWDSGFDPEEVARDKHRTKQENAHNQYLHAMRQEGKPRLTPEQVAALVGKKDGDKVARSAIVFAKGGDVLNVRLQPYFAAGGNVATSAPRAAGILPTFKEAPIWWVLAIGSAVVMLALGMPITTLAIFYAACWTIGAAAGWMVRAGAGGMPEKLFGVIPFTPPTFVIALGLGVWLYNVNTTKAQFFTGLALFAFGAVGLMGWYYRKWRGRV